MTDLERYKAAIARRNIAWCRWQDALVLLEIHRETLGFHDTREQVGQVNATQQEYEHAARDLVHARVWFQQQARVPA